MIRRALSWAAAVLAILIARGAQGQPASSAPPGLRIHTATIHAKSLEGNLAGDPSDQRVAVYLPASYAGSPARRYPVIYFLHGFGADDQIVEDVTLFGDAMDRLAAAGRVPEMLVVVPNGRNRYGNAGRRPQWP
jgi:enterochelin esterase-like enzyme